MAPQPRTRHRRWLAAVVVLVLALPAAAGAASLDVHSDGTALTAYHAYLQALVAGAGAGQSGDAALIATVQSTCAGALKPLGSRRSSEVSQTVLADLGEEIGGDLDLTFLAEATQPFATLGHRLSSLRWSMPATAATVNAFLTAEHTVLGLARSSLCADAKAVAAHPRTEPSATTGFLRTYLGASSALHTRLSAFLGVLGQFETIKERRVVDAIDSLAARYAKLTASARTSGADRILGDLGLSTAIRSGA